MSSQRKEGMSQRASRWRGGKLGGGGTSEPRASRWTVTSCQGFAAVNSSEHSSSRVWLFLRPDSWDSKVKVHVTIRSRLRVPQREILER